ncbi:RrF2 family transcriptional regulator [Lacticaseibacillus chiayiensis]|uniref:RrF2 family transcriptional regulator n=1 Tax=Lacticaseibacillus chiayiensis TaxID=2100821 RepID=UPI0010109DEA|nr:Rrf2 family transcriptional regulator [Lacticaseibacillus chiayiensis]RXT55718.1 Rrf2 family transcriptional regulator [Lacticaseibacillus chiayiensis]
MAFSVAFSQALDIAAYVDAKSQDQRDEYLSIQKISEMLNIPVPSIKKISATLKKNGILSSKTGLNGGLRLAKPADAITIYDILIAIEGRTPLFKIHEAVDPSAFVNGTRVERWLDASSKVLNQAEEAMLKVLKNTSLADLAKGSDRD